MNISRKYFPLILRDFCNNRKGKYRENVPNTTNNNMFRHEYSQQ